MATGIVASPKVFTETTLSALTNGSLSENQALEIYCRGQEAVGFALLELTKHSVRVAIDCRSAWRH